MVYMKKMFHEDQVVPMNRGSVRSRFESGATCINIVPTKSQSRQAARAGSCNDSFGRDEGDVRYRIPSSPNSCPACGCSHLRVEDEFHTSAPVRNKHTRRQVWDCGHKSYQTWVQEHGQAVLPTDRELHEMMEAHK